MSKVMDYQESMGSYQSASQMTDSYAAFVSGELYLILKGKTVIVIHNYRVKKGKVQYWFLDQWYQSKYTPNSFLTYVEERDFKLVYISKEDWIMALLAQSSKL